MTTKNFSVRDLLNKVAEVDDLDAQVVVVIKNSDPIPVSDISFTSNEEEGSVFQLDASVG